MLIFWIFFFMLSFLISFSCYKLFSSKFLGLVVAIIIFAFLSGVWFISPGSQKLAPIISILFLENTIVESNGYLRLFRPFLISISVGILIGLIFVFLRKRLILRKREN